MTVKSYMNSSLAATSQIITSTAANVIPVFSYEEQANKHAIIKVTSNSTSRETTAFELYPSECSKTLYCVVTQANSSYEATELFAKICCKFHDKL